ncbi:hypothetical protein JTE90_004033 [Oedothorax gibbosus]|uniref:ribonuclease H n=1 Tax=Oedothorax gibbosus TaxID=931172 RepID=A0AAV6U4J6_9ARAC|nr:hypothetical protein JTE90_004033 [Oedothorax gibbosus]
MGLSRKQHKRPQTSRIYRHKRSNTPKHKDPPTFEATTGKAAVWGTVVIGRKLRQVLSLQRNFVLAISRGYRTTATIDAIILSGVLPLNIKIREEAMRARVGRMGKIEQIENSTLKHNEYETKIQYLKSHPAHTGKGINIWPSKIPPPKTDITIYTDGTKSEEGVVSAYVIYNKNNEIKTWQTKLEEYNSVFQAELTAIEIAILNTKDTNHKNITILSDSNSSLQAIKDPSNTSPIVKSIQRTLQTTKTRYTMQWIKAHNNTLGNERADTLAKLAVKNEDIPKTKLPKPLSHLKKTLRDISIINWQTQWTEEGEGRRLHSYIHKVDLNKNIGDTTLTQFLTGHATTPSYFHKIGQESSPNCVCGRVGDLDHFSYDCPLTREIHFKNPGPDKTVQKRMILREKGLRNNCRIIINFLQSRNRELCEPAP